ncbi:MAG TPA: 2OG-Fe(II) oxygenase [Allosphingosinicella sp.]|nr:2OG-Fe(II) oxygenase [Allosphingosinicella sp.]
MSVSKGPLPPIGRFERFLPKDDHHELLEWTLAHRRLFQPSTIAGGVLDPKKRISERTRQLGPWTARFVDRIAEHLDPIFAATGTSAFNVDHYELEVVAHCDGAHFSRHTDIPVGPGRKPVGGDDSGRHERLLSAVYYFQAEPRQFSGGQLRLHRLGSDGSPGDYLDVDPVQNSLVVFPSWTSHEVMRVTCQSARFEDGRFAVNCWLCALGR